MGVTFVVLAVLILGSFGFYQESFAKTIIIWVSPSDLDKYDKIDPNKTVKKKTPTINNYQELKTDDSVTRPTFGLSHENNKKIVDNGFLFNNKTFSVTDNFHTPFAKQPVILGEVNLFEAKVHAMEKLRVQEFLFGIPEKGNAHLAELGIEIFYDYFGEIQDIRVVQKTKVIDVDSLLVAHEKAKCLPSDSEANCNVTKISVVFLEPLKDSVMAIKAIDYKNRYQITYLNDGFDISGISLNPATMMIASPEKHEGLIPVTQYKKYSKLWITEDGRIFEKNNFDSFKDISRSFERFQDTGDPKTRLHSGFGGILAYEQNRATEVFDASKLISELPKSFAYKYPKSGERITDDMKQKMLEQEEKIFNSTKDYYR